MSDSAIRATERLYYSDATLTSFTAAVLALRPASDAAPATSPVPSSTPSPVAVALDRSAFYPTSGGQPNDTGTLNGLRVVDVTAEDGVVWHWLDSTPDWKPGDAVSGHVEWARRFDHMQQHSAQHLLSQTIARLLEAETLSVHFGPDESTIDLDVAAVDAAQIDAIEAAATEMLFAALPIRVYSVDEAGVAALPLRKPPAVSGMIRIVEIESYDWSACGGTHCATTAQAGPIKIVRSERRRGGVRLSFLAGGRAVADYRRKHALVGAAAALFSTDMAEVPALIERQQAQVKEQARRLDELTSRLMGHEAAALLHSAAQRDAAEHGAAAGGNGPLVVCSLEDDLDGAALRTLAGQIVTQSTHAGGTVALLGSRREGTLLLAFACTPALPLHMGKLLGETLALAGGKGGGRPDFAQGGGVPADDGKRLLDEALRRLGGQK
jgi:alanyl-tRNA synthetase